MEPQDLNEDQVRQGRPVNWIIRILVVSIIVAAIGMGIEAVIAD